jgi:hypothetical protein
MIVDFAAFLQVVAFVGGESALSSRLGIDGLGIDGLGRRATVRVSSGMHRMAPNDSFIRRTITLAFRFNPVAG